MTTSHNYVILYMPTFFVVSNMTASDLQNIIASQTNISLARNQRLVASWLPPLSPSNEEQSRTGVELDDEDKRTFVPEPELYETVP